MKVLEKNASHLFYDSILDFKGAAVLVESEIRRHGIRYDSDDAVPGMDGRKHHDVWVSMKAVSHFNLGTALELMLKLLADRNNVPLDNFEPWQGHRLGLLHDAIAEQCGKQLESTYRESRRESGLPELVMFNNPATPPPPPTRNIHSLRGFLEYLDEYVMIWKMRYTWEHAKKGRWRYYLNDISVFVELIDRVMSDIPRDSKSS